MRSLQLASRANESKPSPARYKRSSSRAGFRVGSLSVFEICANHSADLTYKRNGVSRLTGKEIRETLSVKWRLLSAFDFITPINQIDFIAGRATAYQRIQPAWRAKVGLPRRP